MTCLKTSPASRVEDVLRASVDAFIELEYARVAWAEGASTPRCSAAAGLRVVGLAYTQGASFWAASTLAWLAAAAFVAFDLVRRLVSRTSQMLLIAARAADVGPTASGASRAT